MTFKTAITDAISESNEHEKREPRDATQVRLDLAWGAEEIGQEIGRNARQTFHLLKSGAIKCAHQRGSLWVADRRALRAEFRSLTT